MKYHVMKVNFFMLSLLLSVIACENDPADGGVQEIRSADGPNASLIRNPISADMPLDTNQLARIVFEEETYDFGTIKEGEFVEHRYKFKNAGTVPLTILGARSSCGCTTPDWPKDPIPPGGTGEIFAKFNSEGRLDRQTKIIAVTANTYPNETKIRLTGIVKEK